MRDENRHPIKLLGDDDLIAIKDGLSILEDYRRLREAYKDIVKRYDDRILIERAKDIICDKMQINMEDAYRKLQKMASSKNTSVGEIAKRLIDVKELL